MVETAHPGRFSTLLSDSDQEIGGQLWVMG
jgi:hypothetical protein